MPAPYWAARATRSAVAKIIDQYLSDRDDFNCVWATPFDPEARPPAGVPFAVVHAHRTEMKMTMPSKNLFTLSVSDRGLDLSAAEVKGEIYTALLEGPR